MLGGHRFNGQCTCLRKRLNGLMIKSKPLLNQSKCVPLPLHQGFSDEQSADPCSYSHGNLGLFHQRENGDLQTGKRSRSCLIPPSTSNRLTSSFETLAAEVRSEERTIQMTKALLMVSFPMTPSRWILGMRRHERYALRQHPLFAMKTLRWKTRMRKRRGLGGTLQELLGYVKISPSSLHRRCKLFLQLLYVLDV